MKAVERFDPEGWKRPNGEWGWRFVAGARWSGVGNGSRVKNSPGFGFETELSGELEIERVSVDCRAESKEQAGSCDLVMVAKASLRASERPFRVSGSGRMRFF